MLNFATFAAVATASVLIAGSAGAADLRVFAPTNPAVHVSLAGKSSNQVDAEIRTAAKTVCGTDGACANEAIDDANSQLRAIARAARTASGSAAANVEVARADPATVRVSLKGKSQAAIEAEISTAANTVCKAASAGGDFNVCVSEAIADAKAQLHFIAEASQSQRLTAN
ncbi:MAG TPA: hypothetical protein VGI79_19890 [Caulobacteraceae bacterium]|jgi:hypothetical protein